MKKNYNTPNVELISMLSKDIITASADFYDEVEKEHVVNIESWFIS